MSQQLAINSFAFAKENRVLEGTLPVSDLARLHDLLTEVSGNVSFRLEGGQNKQNQPQLWLRVSGSLPLACQRCLKAVVFDLEVDAVLILVPEGTELTQDELEDDDRDFLPVAGTVDVAALVEDEILLALPVAPRHEKCGLPSLAEAGDRINPFASLSKLKGKLN